MAFAALLNVQQAISALVTSIRFSFSLSIEPSEVALERFSWLAQEVKKLGVQLSYSVAQTSAVAR